MWQILEPQREGVRQRMAREWGVEQRPLAAHLWERHRILATPIVHAEFRGLHVTPSVYTTLEELDRFAEAMKRIIHRGLPA